MLVSPEKPAVTRQLLIVSRSHHERYAYLKYVFDSENGEVVLDRRVGSRRSRQEPVTTERRRGERRGPGGTGEPQGFGRGAGGYETQLKGERDGAEHFTRCLEMQPVTGARSP